MNRNIPEPDQDDGEGDTPDIARELSSATAASVPVAVLARMALGLDGYDKTAPAYQWRKGWNDALRQAVDYAAAPAPVAEVGDEFIRFLRKRPDGSHWPSGTKLYAAAPAPVALTLTDEQIDRAVAAERDALLDHIYEHNTAAEGVIERVRKLARAAINAATRQEGGA